MRVLAATAFLLVACTAAPPPDGRLDCRETDHLWAEQASVLPDAVGTDTPEEALQEALGPFRLEYGGRLALVDAHTGSLVVNGREVVMARASEAPAGGWMVFTTEGCEGFERP